MAVEVEGTSQVEEFLGVLRRRAAWILVPAAILISLGSAFAVIVPKKYVSKTRVLVRNAAQGADTPAVASNNALEAQVAEHHILSPFRINTVLEDLQWPEYLELDRPQRVEFIDSLQDDIDVTIPPMPRDAGQQVVSIEFAHADPARAREFLEALSSKWQGEVLERGKSAELKSFDSLKEARRQLEQEREDINDEMTGLRKQYDIAPPKARSGFGSAGDPIFEELATNRERLSEFEAQIEEAEADILQKREEFTRMEETVPRTSQDGVTNATKIREREQQIIDLRQSITAQKLLPAHPKYRQIEDKIAALQEEIQYLEGSEQAILDVTSFEPNQKRIRLEEEIEKLEGDLESLHRRSDAMSERLAAQMQESRELNDVYGQIDELQARLSTINTTLMDVDRNYHNAQRAVEWVKGPGGNPFDVLSEVNLPTRPTEPNPILIVLISIFLGLSMGLGLAIVVEYHKNCFRSPSDIGRVMVVPVLGTLNAIATRGQRARTLFAQVVVGSSTLLFVGLIGYVTWAWKTNPHLLSDQVLDSIEDFRAGFR